MIEVTRYQCEHCKKKIYKTKGGARVHEKQCYWNPVNKACASCEHLKTGGIFECQLGRNISHINNKTGEGFINLEYNCKLYKEKKHEDTK